MSKHPLQLRVGELHDQGKENDLLMNSPAERLGVMRQLTLDAWAFKGENIAELRFPRDVIHVKRREG